MSVAFSNFNMLSQDSFMGRESLTVAASSTIYSKSVGITSLDSTDGVFFTINGTRYGTLAADVQVQVQQATLSDAPDAAWDNVGAPQSYGTGGTVGTPASTYMTISIFPSPDESLMPFLRLKFVTQVGAGCTISTLYRSTRGR